MSSMTAREHGAEIDRLIRKREKARARVVELDAEIRSAMRRLEIKVGVPLSDGVEVTQA